MSNDFLGYFGYFFIDLKRDNLVIRLQCGLTDRDGRVPTISSYLKHASYLILSDHLLKDFSLLRANIHHPALQAILINKLQGLEWVILWTVLQEIVQKKILNRFWTLVF